MCYKEFFITELEKQLDGIELLEAKIEFISDEILRCEKVIQDLQTNVESLDPNEIMFAIKQNGCHHSILELLNKDNEIRNAVTKKILRTCKEKLRERNIHFLERAESLMKNLQTKFDLQNKRFSIVPINNGSKVTVDKNERIVWCFGKNKLLEMFEYLNKNEMLPMYAKEEILVHFCDEKQNPFYHGFNYFEKFHWRDSDSSFSIFVDELARRGAIDDKKKYQIFEKHFKNRDGKSFKNLPQKKNYTRNFTKSGNLIITILDSIKLYTIILFSMAYSLEIFLDEYVINTLSYFI